MTSNISTPSNILLLPLFTSCFLCSHKTSKTREASYSVCSSSAATFPLVTTGRNKPQHFSQATYLKTTRQKPSGEAFYSSLRDNFNENTSSSLRENHIKWRTKKRSRRRTRIFNDPRFVWFALLEVDLSEEDHHHHHHHRLHSIILTNWAPVDLQVPLVAFSPSCCYFSNIALLWCSFDFNTLV